MAFKLPVVGQIEFGEKKVSNFWITIAILSTLVIIVSSVTGIFKRKKRR